MEKKYYMEEFKDFDKEVEKLKNIDEQIKERRKDPTKYNLKNLSEIVHDFTNGNIIKHYIIVKWNSEFKNKKEEVENIKKIFSSLLDKDGFFEINLKENVIDKENRFDLMIEIVMVKSVLEDYINSKEHIEFKEKYTKYIDKKAIIDI